VVADPGLASRAEIVREKGTNRSAFLRGQVDKYTWVAEGSSYVLSDVLAAILEAQLGKLAQLQARRSEVTARYRRELTDWARQRGVRLPAELPERGGNHHIFYLLYPDGRARDAALAQLRSRGVMATFHYVPLHTSPHGRTLGCDGGPLPVTDRIASTILRLPLHAELAARDVERVVEAVLETA
jgi:dTDP-4-amino-4,6-dideoxygalactose transaminase